MKKIKKILLLLLAFSFTTLLFNSQAYAVEYYTFELNVTDVSNRSDIQYTLSPSLEDIKDIIIDNGNLVDNDYIYQINGDYSKQLSYNIIDDDIRFNFVTPSLVNILINVTTGIMSDTEDEELVVGVYTIVTDIVISFTNSFWDQIIGVVGDIAVAFQAAATAGISLIYDGTALTSLGEIITITLGVGLVIGLFYLVIRVLPGARL